MGLLRWMKTGVGVALDEIVLCITCDTHYILCVTKC
jgi:hypothetical protein